jgi:enoyl-[acyl-carrier protein] reductase/trans-2-enoyl-CoA reductase (NAD+)
MGGGDLEMWINALLYSGRAAEGMIATALSYIGPDLSALRRMYWDGSLGAAKKHIDATMASLRPRLEKAVGGTALTVMNPAVVTAASAAIPAMLRYISDYLGNDTAGVGKYDDPLDVGILFTQALFGDGEPWRNLLDDEGRLRLDENELEEPLQTAIAALWDHQELGAPADVTREGLERFKVEYMRLFGWGAAGVDYSAAYTVDPPLLERDSVMNLIEE